MRRFLLFLLVLLLPLQSAWAAATAYCQHETRPAAGWHLGHHQHQHRADSKAEASTDAKADVEANVKAQAKAGADHGADAKGLFDPDCGTCHIASLPFACPQAAVLPALRLPRTMLVMQELRYTSLHPGAPDRPQWFRLA